MKKMISWLLILVLMVSIMPTVKAASTPVKPYDDKNVVYLTFDDGPHRNTPMILDILKKHNVKATFFVTGPNAQKNKVILQRMVREGHTIGLHSMTHDKNKFYKTPQTAVKEMQDAQRIVKQLTGVTTNVVRVPYGSVPYMTKSHRDAMTKAGFKMWDWNVDSQDWKYSRSPNTIVNLVKKQTDTKYKENLPSIILMHDQSESTTSLTNVILSLKKQNREFRNMEGVQNPYNFYNKWKMTTQRK